METTLTSPTRIASRQRSSALRVGSVVAAAAIATLAACSDGDISSRPTAPSPTTVTGAFSDGPLTGGEGTEVGQPLAVGQTSTYPYMLLTNEGEEDVIIDDILPMGGDGEVSVEIKGLRPRNRGIDPLPMSNAPLIDDLVEPVVNFRLPPFETSETSAQVVMWFQFVPRVTTTRESLAFDQVRVDYHADGKDYSELFDHQLRALVPPSALGWANRTRSISFRPSRRLG